MSYPGAPPTGFQLIVVEDTTPAPVLLDAATGTGRFVLIKSVVEAEVTVDAGSGKYIDGVQTQTLSQWDCIFLCDYKTNNWVII
jgi:hypothetical protein